MASKSLIITASGWKQFFVPADVKMTFLELREFNVIVLFRMPQRLSCGFHSSQNRGLLVAVSNSQIGIMKLFWGNNIFQE